MCKNVAEEVFEITPVAGFETVLTVGTKIPLGEIILSFILVWFLLVSDNSLINAQNGRVG